MNKLTLTASSMACALRCPRRYYYDNILGLKLITPPEALRIGTAVHNGGEARAKGLDFAAQYAAAFAGGMCYQSHRALQASREFAAWNERVEREATEAARTMSNYELLKATWRKGDTAAYR